MTCIVSRRLERVAFPHRVFDLPEPPCQLHLAGELPRGPAIAVIGTRYPTEEATKYTGELVGEFAKHGVAIWSGGAEGIDIAAHRAALRVGATTVVVAPAGWNRPYPPEHAGDYHEIVERGGAYLSIVAPECVAQRHLFFARNALLMALVDVVVIIQAGLRSGARNAAKFARRLGRTVFVAPSSPWIHQGVGCNLEIGLGARVLLSPKDVIRAVAGYGLGSVSVPGEAQVSCNHYDQSVSTAPRREEPAQDRAAGCSRPRGGPTRASEPQLDAELRELVDAIRAGARYVDALCQRTGLPPAVVQSDVLRLTLLGLVRTDRAGAIDIVTSG
jgi:DNA protecting protein DprA